MAAWSLAILFALTSLALALALRRAVARRHQALLDMAHAVRDAQTTAQLLRQTRAALAALMAAPADALLIVSADGQLAQFNAPAQTLFGLESSSSRTLMSATRSIELDELVQHALAGGEDVDRQVNLNGLPYRARAVLAGGPGSPTAVVVALTDLSEVQRLGRARRDFIANISHELRTPLSSIRLVLESLQRSPAETEAALSKISTELRALEQMSQELLDLAQIESGQSLVRLVEAPLAPLFQSVVERLGPQAAHKQQVLHVQVPGGLSALVDPEQLGRAVGNLIHNAIKFTPARGEIWVRASRQGEDVLAEVEDSGPGIPPEDLPRVFERFFRGDRSRRSGGTGLGLAIARHVVEAHGGRIWVENAQPGRGATFRFTLLAAGPPEPG